MRLALLVACGAAAFAAEPVRVVVIGVDGLGPYGIAAAKTPVIDMLKREGAWTMHARGVIPTVSSPNWASMIMGAGPAQHGIISNEWKPDKFEIAPVCKGPAGMFPTMFGLLRAQRPQARIALFHDWKDFGRLVEPGVLDKVENPKGAEATASAAAAYWTAQKPDLMFVHFDHVDHAGHQAGHSTPEYVAAVAEADRLTGEIVTAIRASGLWSRTVLLLTADHGGTGKGHGTTAMATLEIPGLCAVRASWREKNSRCRSTLTTPRPRWCGFSV